MQTKQISKSEWPQFIANFSRKHEGWDLKLEIFGPDIGAQIEGTGLVLEGLTGEWNELKDNVITITAGDRPDNHVTHSISGPTEVSLERTDEGVDVALSIKSVDGTTALLSFNNSAFVAGAEVSAP